MSDTPHDNSWDELRSLQDTLLKVWQMYVAWFTWSLSLNLLAISYITTRDIIRADFLIGLGIVMSLANAASIGAGVWMHRYNAEVLARGQTLQFGTDSKQPEVRLILGGGIAQYAAFSVPALHFAALIGWFVLVGRYGL